MGLFIKLLTSYVNSLFSVAKIVSEPQDIIAYRRVDENKVLLLSTTSERLSYIVEIK
jgi:hypothetical protein